MFRGLRQRVRRFVVDGITLFSGAGVRPGGGKDDASDDHEAGFSFPGRIRIPLTTGGFYGFRWLSNGQTCGLCACTGFALRACYGKDESLVSLWEDREEVFTRFYAEMVKHGYRVVLLAPVQEMTEDVSDWPIASWYADIPIPTQSSDRSENQDFDFKRLVESLDHLSKEVHDLRVAIQASPLGRD